MTEYRCRVPGCEFTSHARRGIVSHSRKHKRQYREVTGDRHDDYDDVKELLAGRVGADGDLLPRPVSDPRLNDEGQLTLLEAAQGPE